MKNKINLNRKTFAILCIALALLIAVTYFVIQQSRVHTETPTKEIPADTERVSDDSETDNEIDTENNEIDNIDISFESIETDEVTEPDETTVEVLYDETAYEEPTYNYEETYSETYGQEDPYTPYVYPAVEVALTDDEVYRLAALVQFEADALYECKTAITSLFINRMVFYNMSFWDTLNAPGQFVTDWGTLPYAEPDEETLRAVNDVLNNGTTIPRYVMFYKIEGYHDWGDHVGWGVIGTTYFSYSAADRAYIEQNWN